MDRTATATILGFNYQFNKSILEILKADDDKIQVMLEGTKEDLDIFLPDKTIAVQCKYYESTENLTPSVLAKPIFDMLLSYTEDKTLNYKLYIHYKNSSIEKKEEFNNTIFTEILKTKNKGYIKKYFPFIYNYLKLHVIFNIIIFFYINFKIVKFPLRLIDKGAVCMFRTPHLIILLILNLEIHIFNICICRNHFVSNLHCHL